MTTLLIDYNNIAMMKAFHKEVNIESESPNYNMWMFLVFETIYDYIRKFKGVNDVVIAQDNKMYRRRTYFKRYKEGRQKAKDKKDIDWDTFYGHMNEFFTDMKKNFPFKCINIKYCEADDIIGHLALTLDKDMIILSADSDYKQVLSDRVRAYSPRLDKFLTCDDTEQFLIESCLKGQAKDSIFNVITPEDYPADLRKPGFGDVKCKKWLDTGLDLMLNKRIDYDKNTYKGTVLPADRYKVNRVLMDFRMIPVALSTVIEACYNDYVKPEMTNIYEYFNHRGWTRFLEDFQMTENKLITLY